MSSHPLSTIEEALYVPAPAAAALDTTTTSSGARIRIQDQHQQPALRAPEDQFHQARLKFWHVWLSGLVSLPCSRPAHQSNQLIDPSSQSNHPSVNPSIKQLQSLG